MLIRSWTSGSLMSAAAASRVCSAGAFMSTVSMVANSAAEGAGCCLPSPAAFRSPSLSAALSRATFEESTSVRPMTL